MHSIYGNVVQRGSSSNGFSSQECHIESEDDPPESASTTQNPILEILKSQNNNQTSWHENADVHVHGPIENGKENQPTLVNGHIIQSAQRKSSLDSYGVGMLSSGSDSGLSDSEANQAVRVAVESPTPGPASPSTSADSTPTSLSPAPTSPTFSASAEKALKDTVDVDAKDEYHPSLPGEKMPLLGKSLSWVNPKLQARVTKTGCGLFCISPVAKNEYLIVWTGKILSAAEALAIMETHEKHYILQIGDGFYQTPLQDEREPADLTNHSCEPTAGFGANSPVCLTALRDMQIGEEVVFDYGMCETDDRLWEPMDCACGSKYCRSLITAHDWKREELWERYEGCWSPHVQKKVNALRAQKAKEREESEKVSKEDAVEQAVPAAVSSPSFVVRLVDFFLARFGLKRVSA